MTIEYKEEIADAIYNMYENTKQQIQTSPRCFSIDSSSNRGGSSNCSSGFGSSGNLDPERRNKGASKTLKLPETQFTTKKLQHEFKHASDYGITGNWNNINKAAFENAIKNQINSVKNPISGTYRGNTEVYHFYDAKTGLNIMIDKSGNFVGGWKLSADQIANLLRSGNIQ